MSDQASNPFSRIASRKPDFRGRRRGITSTAESLKALLERAGGPERSQLVQLWRNWSMAMGADIASVAIPLGSRKRILLVGAEDNMAMQELTYQVPEILERANGFMDSAYFTRVELHLLLGKTALDVIIAEGNRAVTFAPKPAPPRPEKLGGLASSIDLQSPVGRCYAAYLKAFGLR